MECGKAKQGSREDDELEHQLRGTLQGNPPADNVSGCLLTRAGPAFKTFAGLDDWANLNGPERKSP
jgi:hypothetical protein